MLLKLLEQNNEEREVYFFYLPYWEKNLLNNCLDVMHIEKNVCDNVLYTLIEEIKR